jgi:hypothetical protein
MAQQVSNTNPVNANFETMKQNQNRIQHIGKQPTIIFLPLAVLPKDKSVQHCTNMFS